MNNQRVTNERLACYWRELFRIISEGVTWKVENSKAKPAMQLTDGTVWVDSTKNTLSPQIRIFLYMNH